MRNAALLISCFCVLVSETQANPLVDLGLMVGMDKQSVTSKAGANCKPEKKYVRAFGTRPDKEDVVVCDLMAAYPRRSTGLSPLTLKVVFFKPYRFVDEIHVSYWTNFRDIMKTMPPVSYVLDHSVIDSTESPYSRKADAYWYNEDVVTHLDCGRGCSIVSARDGEAIKKLKMEQRKYIEEERKKQAQTKGVMDEFNVK